MKQKEYLEKMDALVARLETEGATEGLLAEISALKAEGHEVSRGGSQGRSEEELKFCLFSQFGDSSKENKKHIMAAIDAYYAGDRVEVLAALNCTEYKGFARAKVNYETVRNLYRDLAKVWEIDAPKFEKEVEVGKRFVKETESEEVTEDVTEDVAILDEVETETEAEKDDGIEAEKFSRKRHGKRSA